jgi:hypothetical protein
MNTVAFLCVRDSKTGPNEILNSTRMIQDTDQRKGGFSLAFTRAPAK